MADGYRCGDGTCYWCWQKIASLGFAGCPGDYGPSTVAAIKKAANNTAGGKVVVEYMDDLLGAFPKAAWPFLKCLVGKVGVVKFGLAASAAAAAGDPGPLVDACAPYAADCGCSAGLGALGDGEIASLLKEALFLAGCKSDQPACSDPVYAAIIAANPTAKSWSCAKISKQLGLAIGSADYEADVAQLEAITAAAKAAQAAQSGPNIGQLALLAAGVWLVTR